MNDDLTKALEDLGLSQKEAKVYLSNLALGPATVQQIADHSGIKRVTTYVILESLANLGLVSQTNQGKKTFFNAEDPVSLNRLLDRKEQEVKEQKQHLEDILPELNKLTNLPKDTPTVKFYDSTEGIRSLFDTFYQAHQGVKEVYGISNLDQLYAFFPYLEKAAANPDRIKHGIRSKFIYSTEKGPIYKNMDQEFNRESRYVPLAEYPLSGDINIIGNHVVILSLSGSRPIGITIDSLEVSRGMLALFNLAWDAAAKYQ